MSQVSDRIEVTVLGVKEKFQDWINSRGGVKVWRNLNLSNPDAGFRFTPALTEDQKDYPKPHWSVGYQETIRDISRFRFVKSMCEVKRLRVAVSMSGNGLMLKLTEGSSRKLRLACQKIQKAHNGIEPCYHFEGGRGRDNCSSV